MDTSNILMKNSLKSLILYGYIKFGTLFILNRAKYKFIGFTYDRVNNEEVVLHILYNCKTKTYVVKKEKEYENCIVTIVKE